MICAGQDVSIDGKAAALVSAETRRGEIGMPRIRIRCEDMKEARPDDAAEGARASNHPHRPASKRIRGPSPQPLLLLRNHSFSPPSPLSSAYIDILS